MELGYSVFDSRAVASGVLDHDGVAERWRPRESVSQIVFEEASAIGALCGFLTSPRNRGVCKTGQDRRTD